MCFYGSDGVGGAKDAGCYEPYTYLARLAFYTLSVPCIMGFLAACPKRESKLTSMGKMSLYIYL